MATFLAKFLKFISWPVVAGLLAGLLLLEKIPSIQHNATAAITSLAPAAHAAAPAVVNIYTRKVARRHPLLDDPILSRFLGNRRERVQRSLGSGVILRKDGYIVTNNHVIAGADEIQVLLADGRSILAEVIGTDPDSDLAVLRIALNNLQVMSIANVKNSTVGDIVLAIGNPYGFGQTVTQGIISAIGRYGLNLNTFEDFIQTDAAINPGNSGGALVDIKGQLLGINSAIYSKTGASNGIGLAIPADTVTMVVNDIIEHGRVMRGWLGIEVHQDAGRITVIGTHNNGPADTAGLLRGDIILRVNHQDTVDAQQAMNSIANSEPGSKVDITVNRSGQKKKLTAIIGLRPG